MSNKVLVLGILSLFAVVNFLMAIQCQEATGPSFRCERTMPAICASECEYHSGCYAADWVGNWCWDGVCYEWWHMQCNDGWTTYRYCAIPIYPCGL